MKEEIKEEVIEILENNSDVYEGCITDVLNSLIEFQERLTESSINYKILEKNIITKYYSKHLYWFKNV